MTDDGVIAEHMRLRLAARSAAGDLIHAARGFLGAAMRLAEAARAYDPAGEREDPMILGAAETVGELLTLAVASSPGIRQLLAQAVAETAPAEPAAPVDGDHQEA